MERYQLAEQYMRNMMIIHSHRPQRKLAHFNGGEMFILVYLADCGDTSPSTFSEVSGTTSAHVAKVLRHLEAKGEIKRSVDAQDARKRLVSITPAGLQRMKLAREEILSELSNLMQDLGEADAREMVRLSDRVAALVLQKQRLK